MRDPMTRVQRFVSEHPWAILPSAFEAILEVVDHWAAGASLTPEQLAARIEAARRSPAPAVAPGAIAVLPVYGVLSQRVGMLTDISGGTSYEGLGADFRQVAADPNIAAIVFDVDSPGGSVFGLQEIADAIHASRGRKPIVAVANGLAASAAYWLASQADELVVAPGGQVGSIGVIAKHDDISGMAEKAGVKRTFVTAGRFKAEGNEFQPLDDEARAEMQGKVDAYYDTFVRTVARGRSASLSDVRSNFGEGRLLLGKKAVSVGMADREATLQATIDRLAARAMRAAGARAEGTIDGTPIAEVDEPVEIETATVSPEELERRRRRVQVAGAARR